jgi:chromosome segregation ATPase
LTSHITFLTTTTQEHERATAAFDLIADRHAKAKNLDQFPTAKALLIRSKDSQADEVARLGQKVKELRDRTKSMGQSMAAIFNAQPRRQLSSDAKLAAIYSDAKTALTVAESSKKETGEIRDDLQKLKETHVSVQSDLNRSVSFGERIKTLEDRLEATSSSSTAHLRDIQEFRAELRERPRAHAPPFEVPQLNTPAVVSSTAHELQAQYKRIEKNFKEFLDIQAFKDDMQMKLIEDSERKLGDKLKSVVETAKVDSDQARQDLRKQLQEQIQGQVLNTTKAVENLGTRCEITESQLQTLETAIISLESRYNHLTTEPLVLQIIAKMQEIYPTPQIMRNLVETVKDIGGNVSSMPDLWKMQRAIESQGHQLSSLHGHTQYGDMLVPEVQRLGQLLQQREAEIKSLAENVGLIRDDIRSTAQQSQVQEGRRIINEQDIEQLSTKVKEMSETQDRLKVELQSLLGKIESLGLSRLEGIESQIQSIQGIVEKTTRELLDKIGAVQQAGQAEIQDVLKALGDSRQLSMDESEELLHQVEDLKNTGQKELRDALARLQNLEVARSSLEERLASGSSSDLNSGSQPYVKPEYSPSQSELGSQDVVAVDKFGELARRTLEKNNKKRKRESHHISDENLESYSRFNSNRSTPSLEDESSQSSQTRQGKRSHRSTRSSAKPNDFIELG